MSKNIVQLQREYIRLLEEMNGNLRGQLAHALTGDTSKAFGVVYVLKRDDTTHYKIGFSTEFPRRKQRFDVKLPFKVTEILVHYTENYRKIEEALHAEYSEHRLNNSEFFDLNDELVGGIQGVIDRLEIKIAEGKVAARPGGDDDELMEKARKLMVDNNIALEDLSSSYLQRKLRVGFARAARIKDDLLENG
ncbi:hypothetical protein HN747_03155 [archaeon]|jgi:DNA segregation ATPase FtsK/SpoIIIE-like protein|nr:hypothetical protein [archaeon]